MAIFAVVHQLLIIRLLAPQALWQREPSGLMRKRTTARSRCCTAYFCILERRAQLWALASHHSVRSDQWLRHGQVVVSLHRGASTYAYGQFPWYTARKPTIGDSPLTLLSHMPTIRESVPSDHRTKRCRRGSEPIVYGSRPCNFAAEGKVAESEESRSVRAQTLVRFSSKSFRRFSSYSLTPRKFHN